MREPQSSAVVGDDVRDLLLADALLDDLAEFEGGLLVVDLVGLESTFNVIEDSEVLVGFLNCNNVHLSEGESGVSSDFAVNLDQALLVLYDLS